MLELEQMTFADALHLFVVMSGLKVNFHKSTLIWIHVNDSWLNKAASVLNCKVGRLPFLYLGLSIRGDAHRAKFWERLLDCIKLRLCGWKNRYLSCHEANKHSS